MTTIDKNGDVRLRPDFGQPHNNPYYVPHVVEQPTDCYSTEGGMLHSLIKCVLQPNPVNSHKTSLPRKERKRIASVLLTSLRTKITPKERRALIRTVESMRGKKLAITDDLSLRREAIRALRHLVSPEHFIYYMAGLLLSPLGTYDKAVTYMAGLLLSPLGTYDKAVTRLERIAMYEKVVIPIERIALYEVENVCKELGPKARFVLPLLARTIYRTPDGFKQATFRALRHIGAEAIPIIVNWITPSTRTDYIKAGILTLHEIGMLKLMDLPQKTARSLWPRLLFLLLLEPHEVESKMWMYNRFQ